MFSSTNDHARFVRAQLQGQVQVIWGAASCMVIMRRVVGRLTILDPLGTRDIDFAVRASHLDSSKHEGIAVDIGDIVEDCIGRRAGCTDGVLKLGHVWRRQVPDSRDLAFLRAIRVLDANLE